MTPINITWDLYHRSMDCSDANEALNEAMTRALNDAFDRIINDGMDERESVQIARKEFAIVQNTYRKFGAFDFDSEPDQQAYEIFNNIFPGSMYNRWDYDYNAVVMATEEITTLGELLKQRPELADMEFGVQVGDAVIYSDQVGVVVIGGDDDEEIFHSDLVIEEPMVVFSIDLDCG